MRLARDRLVVLLVIAVLILLYVNNREFVSCVISFNPLHPNCVGGNASVSRVTKVSTSDNYCDWNVVLFFSHDYKDLPEYARKSIEVYSKYCQLHQYTLYNLDHSSDDSPISPYWLRVRDFIHMCEANADNTLLFYLDLDTCINPKYMNTPLTYMFSQIESITGFECDMFVGADPGHILNSGAIVLKNTKWTREFLAEWWTRYDPRQWNISEVSGKWTCSLKMGEECRWARDGYEQGELNIMYENNIMNCRDRICVTHPTIMSFGNVLFDAFIYHFMGGRRQKDMGINHLHRKLTHNIH